MGHWQLIMTKNRKPIPSPSIQPTPDISWLETFSNHKNPYLILLHLLQNTLALLGMPCSITQLQLDHVLKPIYTTNPEGKCISFKHRQITVKCSS